MFFVFPNGKVGNVPETEIANNLFRAERKFGVSYNEVPNYRTAVHIKLELLVLRCTGCFACIGRVLLRRKNVSSYDAMIKVTCNGGYKFQ